MNLVQKLPIGLSLACLMFMSSCSKEDALTPEPQMESVNGHSSLRDGSGPTIYLPYFAPTKGSTGFNVYPKDWKRNTNDWEADNPIGLPTGTSSLSHLWGNSLLPWKKPLPAITSNGLMVNNNSILTTTTHYFDWKSGNDANSSAKTTIKNLKSGKKYEITIKFASTICQTSQNAYIPAYAKQINIAINEPHSAHGAYVDMTGKEAVWVTKTMTFTAESTELDFVFSANTSVEGGFSYAHIYVDKNSIKEVN